MINEEQIFDKFEPSEFDKVVILKQSEDEILFEISHMYDWYNDNDKDVKSRMQTITESMGFNNYDIYEDISQGGCETCDYGSSYGFAVRMWR